VTLTGLALRLHQRLRTALGDGALLKASFAEISSDGCQAELLNAGMGAVLRVGEISDDIESIDVGNAPLGGGHDGLRETRAVSIALRPQDRLLLCASPSELAEDAEIEALSVARLRRRIVRNRHRANLLDELLTDINLHCPELAGRAVLEWRNRQKPVVSDSPYPQASAAATAWTYRLDLSVGMLCHFDPLPLLLDAAAQAPGLIERAARFRRLTQELLENALEHGLRGRPNGHLRVELRYREDAIGYRRLTLAIEDSGPGFNHEAWFALEKVEAGLRGRGIAIARELSEWLRYRGRGNLVEASFRWPVSCDLNVSLPYDPPATTFHRRL
jgi:anti-sigma regulatory factor (Ser/Thr protein kinase)